MLPLGEDDGLRRTLLWRESRAIAIAAEVSGLDSIWATDHLVFHNGDRHPLNRPDHLRRRHHRPRARS